MKATRAHWRNTFRARPATTILLFVLLLAGPSQTSSESAVDRIWRVLTPVLRAADEPIDAATVAVSVESDSRPNAWLAGGKTYRVTRGLLDAVTDERLAAILAHEVAHHELGHPARAAQFIGIPDPLDRGHLLRRLELEADVQGIRILERVGIHFEIFLDTLRWFATIERPEPSRPIRIEDFGRTHPGNEFRAKVLSECLSFAVCQQMPFPREAGQSQRRGYSQLMRLEPSAVRGLSSAERRNLVAGIVGTLSSQTLTVVDMRGRRHTVTVAPDATVYTLCKERRRMIQLDQLEADDPVVVVMRGSSSDERGARVAHQIETLWCKD